MLKRILSWFIVVSGVAGMAFAQGAPGSQPASAPRETAAPPAGAKNPVVILKTSMGDIEIELLQDKAPITVANFLGYVKDGFYDGTIFHRVMSNFMIQGGGMTRDGREKPTKAPIKNEAANGLKNEKYTVAMARTGEVDSATSQFFINVADNALLDHGVRDYGYAVFGKVIKGQDVVDKIKAIRVRPDSRGEPSVPLEPVVIESAKVKEDLGAAPAAAKTPAASPASAPASAPAKPAQEKKP
ncbi:MAG: peptidylprolyl isomerase [Candidatus Sumerlaeota bacterium]|nr:peptidylprolyl isomerase [Candidatus Sumerlaeota bacterium]